MSGPTKAQINAQLETAVSHNVELQASQAAMKESMALMQEQVAALTAQADIDVSEPAENPLPSTDAINKPVIIRKTLEAPEQDLGVESTMHFERDETGSSILIGTGVYDFESPSFNEKMANLHFMKEPVTVHIHETSHKDADPRFEVSVNGHKQFFRRGTEVTVARMFVEGLARAKPVMYENKEFTDDDGVRMVKYPSRKGLRYSFAVVNDANPIGANWLKSVLAQ